MALYGVIGDPISHSLSPLIHRGWMRDLGMDHDYRAFRVPAGQLEQGLESLAREGLRGINVTLPHKIDVLDQCATVSDLARTLGAVNTLSRLPDGGWAGDNTDYQGFLDDFVRILTGVDIQPSTILLLGAGGAAQAIARGLFNAGFAVRIANRTQSRAADLAIEVGIDPRQTFGLFDMDAASQGCDMIVNTLSAGHGGWTLPLPAGSGRIFYDISYGKAAASALAAARAEGWQTADGLGMLVGQAARSFEIWHGVQPDHTAALKRCRTALEMAT